MTSPMENSVPVPVPGIPQEKRGRGRPRKAPPVIAGDFPDIPEQAEEIHDVAEEVQNQAENIPENIPAAPRGETILSDAPKFVTITIPVCELTDESGYQISKRNPPREFRQRRLSISQGLALAKIRLGMISVGECLDSEERFIDEHQKVAIENKEQVLCRLLEYVANAMDS